MSDSILSESTVAARRAAAAEAEEAAQRPARRAQAGRPAPGDDRHRLRLEDRRAVEAPPRDERLPFGAHLPPPTPRMARAGRLAQVVAGHPLGVAGRGAAVVGASGR